jgi:hypothetical protein
LLLRALSDPQDGVSLVGVLRGPLFGISDQDLFAFRQAGGWFSIFSGADQRSTPNSDRGPKAAAASPRSAAARVLIDSSLDGKASQKQGRTVGSIAGSCRKPLTWEECPRIRRPVRE